MLITTGCVLIIHDILSPTGFAKHSLYAFLQYDPDPVSTVEHLAHRIPRPKMYKTELCYCYGSDVQASLEALLNFLKNLDEVMRKNPPVELFVEAIKGIYDKSSLVDAFQRYFDKIVTLAPLSRISASNEKYYTELALINPSYDELLRAGKLLDIRVKGETVAEKVNAIRNHFAELYAKHDMVPEIPSLWSYLRHLAVKYSLVSVNPMKHNIIVGGVELAPPTLQDFERVVDYLGLHLQYYGSFPPVTVKYRAGWFRRVALSVKVAEVDGELRVFIPPESLKHLLHENEVCQSMYMLVKTVKKEHNIIAEVYLIHVGRDGIADVARVLSVDVTKCGKKLSCILSAVSKAARSLKIPIIIYRLVQRLSERGYNVRLVYTKEYSYISSRYVNVFEVKASKIDGSTLYTLSYLNGLFDDFVVHVVTNERNYDMMRYFFCEVENLVKAVRARVNIACPRTTFSLHGYKIEIPLETPDQVAPVLNYVEEFFKEYARLVSEKRALVDSFDRREAVIIYLATMSSVYYGLYKWFSDAYKLVRTEIPWWVLVELCNALLSGYGASIRDVYEDADRVINKLFDANLIVLDDNGSFTVLGMQPQYVIDKYRVPSSTDLVDMFILRALLKKRELNEVTGGRRPPLRLLQLMLRPAFSAYKTDRAVLVKGLMYFVGDEDYWRSLPSEYRASVIKVGGKELVFRAIAEGYAWVLDGYLDMVLPLLETPSERTLVYAATTGVLNSVYVLRGQYYLKYRNVVLQVREIHRDGAVFHGSVTGYPVGIVVKAATMKEAVEKVASDLLDAYLEYRELVEELSKTKPANIRVDHEDAGLFKIPVFIVNETTKLYLEKGVTDKLRALLASH